MPLKCVEATRDQCSFKVNLFRKLLKLFQIGGGSESEVREAKQHEAIKPNRRVFSWPPAVSFWLFSALHSRKLLDVRERERQLSEEWVWLALSMFWGKHFSINGYDCSETKDSGLLRCPVIKPLIDNPPIFHPSDSVTTLTIVLSWQPLAERERPLLWAVSRERLVVHCHLSRVYLIWQFRDWNNIQQ